MSNVLVIDDNEGMCHTLSSLVKLRGHDTTCAFTLKQGLEAIRRKSFDIVFLDVWLPDGNGLDVLPSIRKAPSKPEVIIITALGDSQGAELAITGGAWDYIEKPFSIKAMIPLLNSALFYREGKKNIGEAAKSLNRAGIIGRSPRIRACLDLVAQAAYTDATVLITGESGTGKERFAQAIHVNSSRADNNFVVIDCTAIPESLVESILFGHEKGAFTGADRARSGLFSEADGGTLFLDEIGELPLFLQKTFLRVIQEQRFRPLGSKQEIQTNFRLVAATNQDLCRMAREGRFREDLLFRLQAVTIELPPLRKRKEDIVPLAMHYTFELCKSWHIEAKGFSPEFLEALTSYNWPGNVRELIKVLEAALVAARTEPVLFPKHLPTFLRILVAQKPLRKQLFAGFELNSSSMLHGSIPTLQDIRESALAQTERRYLQDILSFTRGNIAETCKIAGLSRSRLYALLTKYEMSRHN